MASAATARHSLSFSRASHSFIWTTLVRLMPYPTTYALPARVRRRESSQHASSEKHETERRVARGLSQHSAITLNQQWPMHAVAVARTANCGELWRGIMNAKRRPCEETCATRNSSYLGIMVVMPSIPHKLTTGTVQPDPPRRYNSAQLSTTLNQQASTARRSPRRRSLVTDTALILISEMSNEALNNRYRITNRHGSRRF